MAVPEFYSGKLLYPAIAVLIGLSALFGVAIRPRLVLQGGGMVGKPAPDLSLPVVANGAVGPDGERAPNARMSLADLKGHPVLLDFWASWCGPCALDAPVVDRVSRRFGKKGLVVLGVNVSDSPEVIKAYAAQKGLSYPMVLDPGSTVSGRYGVKQLPSLVVIDRQGNVLAFLTGMVDEASLNDIVTAAM
jgi:cytochrome c biogenesis protein CcmG/thiol:disulfide interchange protein DsbE